MTSLFEPLFLQYFLEYLVIGRLGGLGYNQVCEPNLVCENTQSLFHFLCPGPRSPVPVFPTLFNLTSRHQVVTCTLFPVYAGKRRPVFAPAANFQQLIALKVISPEHRSASRHYYLTQTKSALHHPSSIHQIVCLAFPLFEC